MKPLLADTEPATLRAADTASARPPKVLVLLAAFNGAKWIREQIQSILLQEGVDVAISVADDGSTDATLAEIAAFEDDGRVTVLKRSHPNGSAAQNFFMLMRQHPADGFDFVALSDQDDIWYAHKLSMACKRIRADNAAGYSSATLASWDDGTTAALKPSGKQNASDFLLEGAGQGCTFVMEAGFYSRARGFFLDHSDLTDGVHFHDWALYALARSWDLHWTLDARVSMIYRQHDDNDTGARGSLGGLVRRFARVRSGWYREQLAAIGALCAAAAPESRMLAAWRSTLSGPRCLRRTWQLIGFCLRGGRRRARDNAVVLLAAIAGWI